MIPRQGLWVSFGRDKSSPRRARPATFAADPDMEAKARAKTRAEAGAGAQARQRVYIFIEFNFDCKAAPARRPPGSAWPTLMADVGAGR